MTRWKQAALGALTLTAASAAFASPAMADDELPFTFNGGVTFLNDYRLRGASLSDTKPVIQGSVEAGVPIAENVSAFAGVWASSLDKDAGAGAMETDLYAGMQGTISGVKVRARYLRLVFHDAENIDFDQYEVGVSGPVGPVTLGAGVIHDEYHFTGHSTYTYTSATLPIDNTGFAVKGLVGYEDGTRWNDKVNWQLGVSYARGHFLIGADYIDTNKFSAASNGDNRAGATVVGYIGARF
ncbi:TorF family putative porin [Novosphingobium sp. PY1]|uniref:Outer membrane protein beta-barrel domain-containing protein n=1 Tax=Ochrobactrum sp. PW1 TaxID=1882222 RepID=A0A292GSB6_9HYPH|nr:TorF family putative porin [Novosphingobium sp. PY1]BBA74366.1 hypothetical protein [Ochrobactrum sp. PW1]GFM29215.1 uncharacterized protein PY1_contig-07-141 [Novosphingobium sp. PY1]